MASKTIIWNGPMGVFEMKSFETGAFGLGCLWFRV
jgi:3-phosphoglycerate kinase